MKIKIAITGGIGSGKSTFCQCVKELGFPVFSCDEIYREIIGLPEYIDQVKSYFSDCIVNEKIDKKRLSNLIFSDSKNRKILNGISHPFIMKRLYEYMNECPNQQVFAEVPLLFEGGFEKDFDVIVVLFCDKNIRVKRLEKRDENSKAFVEAQMHAQFDYFSLEAKRRFSSCNAILIENDGSMEDLKDKAKTLCLSFCKSSSET